MCSQPSASSTAAVCFGILVIALHHGRAANENFAGFARRHVGALAVDDPGLEAPGQARRADLVLARRQRIGEDIARLARAHRLNQQQLEFAEEFAVQRRRQRRRRRTQEADALEGGLARLSARGSFQSRSCEMIVGTTADQVQRYSSSQSQNWLTLKRCGTTTEPPLSSVGIRVTHSALM